MERSTLTPFISDPFDSELRLVVVGGEETGADDSAAEALKNRRWHPRPSQEHTPSAHLALVLGCMGHAASLPGSQPDASRENDSVCCQPHCILTPIGVAAISMV